MKESNPGKVTTEAQCAHNESLLVFDVFAFQLGSAQKEEESETNQPLRESQKMGAE